MEEAGPGERSEEYERDSEQYLHLKNFSRHPFFNRHMERCIRLARSGRPELYFGIRAPIKNFYDPLHPAVYLIPRNIYYNLTYADGESVGIDMIRFPFSSYDFYVNEDLEGPFKELYYCSAFFRLGYVNQLAYLVLPNTDPSLRNKIIHYLVPAFPHTRFIHSYLTAVFTEIVLARAGFSAQERNKVVLAFGCHDIGMPAGGDSIIRIDPANLDEEKNFGLILETNGLADKWKKKFGFDLEEAGSWIRGEGMHGRLLSALDRISYVGLDCYHLGLQRKGRIRKLCLENPLIMDVWQDVCFTRDKKNFYFCDPERLYLFLLLRAYEHVEFLLNPYSRALDFFLTKKAGELYHSGKITKEQLLREGDEWLFGVLERHDPKHFKSIISPDLLSWEKFTSKAEQKRSIREAGPLLDHAEEIRPFRTGLNWPVLSNGKICELRDAIDPVKSKALDDLSRERAGYYVYRVKKEGEEE